VLSVITLLADGDADFTCQPEGFRVASPVKARRALARERLSSYREPASRNPQAMYPETCWEPCTRAPFRLLSIRAPRQAVLRTSSWLAPSLFTNRPCDLPVEKTRDASNRRLPPNRTACTRTSRVPSSLSQLSLRGRPVESWAPRDTTGGIGVSRRLKPLRRIVIQALVSSSTASRPGERAWACCSHGADPIEPLTPLSRSSVHPHASVAFAPAAMSPPVLLLEGGGRVGECREPPRSP